MSETVTFVAALAGSNTAAKCLSVSRDGDAKLVLEIPASDLAQVLRILGWGEMALRLTATPLGSKP